VREVRIVAASGEPALNPFGQAEAIAIADELVGLTNALSDLAYDLGSDPDTLRKHMNSLQAIDLITQIHLALADLLRSEAPLHERLADIPVEALAARMKARILGSDLV
jgi:hypothetical protein